MIQQTELFKKVTKYNDHMENNGLSRLALTSREVSKGQMISKGIFIKVTFPKNVKSGLLSESFSLWLHPPKNVPNYYPELCLFSLKSSGQ